MSWNDCGWEQPHRSMEIENEIKEEKFVAGNNDNNDCQYETIAQSSLQNSLDENDDVNWYDDDLQTEDEISCDEDDNFSADEELQMQGLYAITSGIAEGMTAWIKMLETFHVEVSKGKTPSKNTIEVLEKNMAIAFDMFEIIKKQVCAMHSVMLKAPVLYDELRNEVRRHNMVIKWVPESESGEGEEETKSKVIDLFHRCFDETVRFQKAKRMKPLNSGLQKPKLQVPELPRRELRRPALRRSEIQRTELGRSELRRPELRRLELPRPILVSFEDRKIRNAIIAKKSRLGRIPRYNKVRIEAERLIKHAICDPKLTARYEGERKLLGFWPEEENNLEIKQEPGKVEDEREDWDAKQEDEKMEEDDNCVVKREAGEIQQDKKKKKKILKMADELSDMTSDDEVAEKINTARSGWAYGPMEKIRNEDYFSNDDF